MIKISIGSVSIGNDLPLVLIGGPCEIKSRDHALELPGICRCLDILVKQIER